MLFLLIGAFFIISENNLVLKKQENIDTFYELYFSWLSRIFDNSKEITGDIIKLDWLPGKS